MFTEQNQLQTSPYAKFPSFQDNNREKDDRMGYKKTSFKNKRHYCLSNNKKNSTTEEQFMNSSSCCSHKNYDFIGDYLDSNTYCLKNKKSKLDGNKIKTSKSDDKKIVVFSEEQQKLFGHVSIIQIKQKKKLIQQHRRSLEGDYSFMIKKINHLKRASFLQNLNNQKLNQIKKAKRQLSQNLHKTQKQFKTRDKRQKMQIKMIVQNQRLNRQEKLYLQQEHNNLQASRQRLFQKQLQSSLQKASAKDLKQKKQKMLKQKLEREKRRNIVSRKVQQKKQKAKQYFRSKWIKQLHTTENAKNEYFKREQILKQKMEGAVQTLSVLFDKKHD